MTDEKSEKKGSPVLSVTPPQVTPVVPAAVEKKPEQAEGPQVIAAGSAPPPPTPPNPTENKPENKKPGANKGGGDKKGDEKNPALEMLEEMKQLVADLNKAMTNGLKNAAVYVGKKAIGEKNLEQLNLAAKGLGDALKEKAADMGNDAKNTKIGQACSKVADAADTLKSNMGAVRDAVADKAVDKLLGWTLDLNKNMVKGKEGPKDEKEAKNEDKQEAKKEDKQEAKKEDKQEAKQEDKQAAAPDAAATPEVASPAENAATNLDQIEEIQQPEGTNEVRQDTSYQHLDEGPKDDSDPEVENTKGPEEPSNVELSEMSNSTQEASADNALEAAPESPQQPASKTSGSEPKGPELDSSNTLS